ncbi:MAG: hypothetical protein HY963_01090 [Ignavibacteriales bacterium]|nr:hypothetical protein [Ignavibacteriales bacterium]
MKTKNITVPKSRLTVMMQRAIAEEIEKRRKLGYPIAVWKDGKVIVGKVEDISSS